MTPPMVDHDIIVHYKNREHMIYGVHASNYLYSNLLSDTREKVLDDIPGNLSSLISMTCEIPNTYLTMDVNCDEDLKHVFNIYADNRIIHIIVDTVDIIASPGQVNDDSSDDEEWVALGERGEGSYHTDPSELFLEKNQEVDEFPEVDDKIDDDSDVDENNPMGISLRGKKFTYDPSQKLELEKGDLFTSVDAFRAALKDCAIQEGIKLVRIKNEKARCTVKCGMPGCSWRIHASPLPDGITYKIKSLNDGHSCIRDDDNNNNKEANSTWIAKKLVAILREDPEMTNKGVMAIMKTYGLSPNRMQLWRAKCKALEEIEGSHKESYANIAKYAEMFRESNPRSIFKVHYNRPNFTISPKFQRCFFSFPALRNGLLEGCRPFVGFDGCHLKGPYGGVLLSAVALDANNGLFPVAFAIVESEQNETWRWFFYWLNDFVGSWPRNKPWTFMSDRQKGLHQAYEEMIPFVSGRYCARHIYANFKAQYPGLLLKNYFWQAVTSYEVKYFNEAMEIIKKINPKAWDYLSKIDKRSWARHAFDPRVKTDHITNNISESFNSWIDEWRGKPILTLIDGLRAKLMTRLQTRYQKGRGWVSGVPPTIVEKLNKVKKHSRRCTLQVAAANEFEVIDKDRRFIVNLDTRTCKCGVFQISGLPCKHAALGIAHKRDLMETYCDPMLKTEAYLKSYGESIHPVPDETFWPPMNDILPAAILPPDHRRRPGRPTKNRKRATDERNQTSQSKRSCTLRCSNCKQFGHNKRTCQGAPVRAKGKKGMGYGQTKGGPGLSTAGLSGAVLWEHATGNIPIVVSTRGSQSSSTPPSKNATAPNASLNGDVIPPRQRKHVAQGNRGRFGESNTGSN